MMTPRIFYTYRKELLHYHVQEKTLQTMWCELDNAVRYNC